MYITSCPNGPRKSLAGFTNVWTSSSTFLVDHSVSYPRTTKTKQPELSGEPRSGSVEQGSKRTHQPIGVVGCLEYRGPCALNPKRTMGGLEFRGPCWMLWGWERSAKVPARRSGQQR